MAVYRLVHTTFWTDAKVSEDFTPNERFFMLFLMTNDLSSQIGVYEIGKRRMAFMTGLTPEEIDHCINRLREYGVIDYDEKTHEVYIKNWSRYNWIKSPKVRECIFKELRGIKSEKFYNESKKSFEEFYGVSVGEEVADGDAVPVDSDEDFGEEDIIRTNDILCNTEDLSENDDMETPPENDSDKKKKIRLLQKRYILVRQEKTNQTTKKSRRSRPIQFIILSNSSFLKTI